MIGEEIQLQGDQPLPRFGHTITLVSKNIAILFGGAIGDTGKFNITGDTYQFNISNLRWTKLSPNGQAPANRAAHCSLCIDNLQMVVFGGAIGGGGLADDSLYALDLKNGEQNASWLQISVVGSTPGRRYGHAMVFMRPYLLVNGGNTGAEPVNDVWSLNLEKSPYNWTKLETGDSPPVRVYHSAALCSQGSANGMMVIFGGRTGDQSALNDTWGLRRHRDGRWDWVKAPYKGSGELPTSRYQHSTIFVGSLMLVIGGRSNQVGETLPFELYDTESSDWYKFNSIQRFRHTLWYCEPFLFIHGGFDQDHPNVPTESMLKIELPKLFQKYPSLTKAFMNQKENQKNKREMTGQMPADQQQQQNGGYISQPGMEVEVPRQQRQKPIVKNNSNQIILADKCEVAQTYNPDEKPEFTSLIPLQNLTEEWRRIGTGFSEPNAQVHEQQVRDDIASPFIEELYLPVDFFKLTPKHNFFNSIKKEQIIRLLDKVEQMFHESVMVTRVNVPIKIFGNINGQFGDLMKLFSHYGSPVQHEQVKQDIDGVDYLFLGNYVNRGTRSLETILLLFAFKLKYPKQFHLLRGNQEDKTMTKVFGLGDECIEKLKEDITDPKSVFAKINKVFEYMPLAAVVEDKILCVHGGIGQTIRSINDIDIISRPLEIIHDPKLQEHKIPIDLLWSDPVPGNQLENMQNQEHDYFGLHHVIRFGFSRLQKFMKENEIDLIIRSNEPVKEGYEAIHNKIMTVFSCTDYGGLNQNAAGIIHIKKNWEITPKIINSNGGGYNMEDRWLNLEQIFIRRNQYRQINQMEEQELNLRKRPPTPCRLPPKQQY